MFSEAQKEALAAKLDGAKVKTRSQAGQTLSYIEGWVAISEANRIFGFDGWSRETVDTRCVWEGTRTTRAGKELMTASYTARVRVTVRAGGEVIVREGTGAGSGMGSDGGEAHESAIKEAETDAMKRALMTFGNPFGLALYDKMQADVERGDARDRQKPPMDKDPIHEARREIDEAHRERDEKALKWISSGGAAKWQAEAIATLQRIRDNKELSRWLAENNHRVDALANHAENLYAPLNDAIESASLRIGRLASAA